MQKISSRDKFVEEVVKSIATSDDVDEAFIFGISGKWGEGKTFFLKKLKTELEKSQQPTMKVIELNPWKYAHDDGSILRELLRQLLSLHDNRVKRWWLSRKLKSLYHDVSSNRINWLLAAVVTVIFLILGIIYKYPPTFLVDMKQFISQNKSILTLLLIPVLLGVANAITTSQSSTKAVFTRDKFDELFNDLLKGLDIGKIVVYVDDLDRLTASKALAVLDSLRTFFDKNDLVFIVASDHTVLERHLGHELKPEASLPEQLEEGRRFLKKIFNVYWRLPLPTKPEYEKYIDSLIGKESDQFVHDKLLSPTNRKLFKQYLLNYFSNNFRNSERFINRVEFTFRLIEAQHTAKTTSRQNKEYFGEMLKNPLLVIRILFIEEMANPLFEKIQHKPELLIRLEQYATDNEFEANVYTSAVDDLSVEQANFMKSFLSQKPRFRDESGVRVKSIEPYIFLSSDSSFGDIRGLSPKEFLKYLQTDQIAELVTILNRSSEQKIGEAMKASTDVFAGLVGEAKTKFMNNLIEVTTQLDSKLPAQPILTASIINLDFTSFGELPSSDKIAMLSTIGSLDYSDGQFTQLLENTPPLVAADWSVIPSLAGVSLPLLTQYKILRYFKEYFVSNPGDAILQLGAILTDFSAVTVNAVLNDFTAQLIRYFIDDNTDIRRQYGLALLRMTDEGVAQLRLGLEEQLKLKNRTIFNWLAEGARSSTEPLLSIQDLVRVVLEPAFESTSTADLAERMIIFESLPEAKDMLWASLLQLDRNNLVDTLYETIALGNYAPITPSSEVANILIDSIIRRFITKESVNNPETIAWFERISPSKWLFTNLRMSPSVNRLIDSKLKTQYLPDGVRENLERVKGSFLN